MDYLRLKKEALQLLDEGMRLAEVSGYPEAKERINRRKKRLNKNEIVIVACGEIKRGKSSLLSALLEEKGLFPIDVNVATNIVTIARYGKEEKIEAIFEKNNKMETKLITREEIIDYVTEQGNKNNDKRVRVLRIQVPNPKLKEGLIFVDTPGVGSLNIEHGEITYNYLPNADVVLFISDVLSPLTESELTFLKTAKDCCDNFIFPLTKIDKSSDYKEIYEANIKKISEYTSIPKDDILVVPVSSLAKIRYIDTKNPMMLRSSNFKKLENAIWSRVRDKRAQILLTPPLMELSKELLTIENNNKIQKKALTQSKESVMELENILKKASEDRLRLLEDSADWRRELDYELANLFDNLIEHINNTNGQLNNMLDTQFKDKNIIKKLDEVTKKLNEELYKLTFKCRKNILINVEKITESTEKKLGLLLTVSKDSLNILNFDEDKTVDYEQEKRSKIDSTIMVGRNIMMSTAGATAIGGVIGGAIGGTIGFLTGGPVAAYVLGEAGVKVFGLICGTIGGGRGMQKGMEQLKISDVPKVSREYKKYLNDNIINIRNMVMKIRKDLKYTISQNLNDKIKAQRNALEKDISDIKENLSLSKNEAIIKGKKINEIEKTTVSINSRIAKMLEIFSQENKQREVENKNNKRNFAYLD